MRLAPSEFLARLAALFASAAEKHSVYVTVKRAEAADPAPLLYRATDGQSTGKTKLSTLVPPAEHAQFEGEYLALLRTQLAGMLKKRDKAKERRVDKILAASRKKLEENDGKVRITGSKRGAGRRKRMRALHRARRLREARRHP
ncbi:hypothetical protein MOBT1_000800 [Malassezia obtusa]|uniref:Signal recognition particle subunit SRP14 n=1 Tax=Malassezia obtusa TaxID=76774 RepID=A0AAF0IVJ5_9BASI|nr:hypothetical protein MOBT1_000800 [Malassezia obtusa]